VRRQKEDTAASTFARAAVTGRLVQQKGLRAANLVPEIERFARRSRELDPDFRDGAATRLLGTLYVVAPATLLRHGDSEVGLAGKRHEAEIHGMWEGENCSARIANDPGQIRSYKT
jgi:hypothetical protein